MNRIKHNLIQRGLAEYKAGLLSILGRILGRVKVHTSREGDATEFLSGITPYFSSCERGTLATSFCSI